MTTSKHYYQSQPNQKPNKKAFIHNTKTSDQNNPHCTPLHLPKTFHFHINTVPSSPSRENPSASRHQSHVGPRARAAQYKARRGKKYNFPLSESSLFSLSPTSRAHCPTTKLARRNRGENTRGYNIVRSIQKRALFPDGGSKHGSPGINR